jgi:hypothetical protein
MRRYFDIRGAMFLVGGVILCVAALWFGGWL